MNDVGVRCATGAKKMWRIVAVVVAAFVLFLVLPAAAFLTLPEQDRPEVKAGMARFFGSLQPR